MKTLYFITGNKGKYSEVQGKFKNIDVKITQKNLGYPEIQGDSLENVAGYGVDNIKKRFSHPFIIEDAGLFIDKLSGFPGVYSKYIFCTIGCKGILTLLKENKKRTAVFKSVYGLSVPNKKPKFFNGQCHGRIANVERGYRGFGFDPIFIPNGEIRTFAEMRIEEKNNFSHRGKALNKLIDFLKKN